MKLGRLSAAHWVALMALGCASCVALPDELESAPQTELPRLSVAAYDGSPADPLAAPRRPRLRIAGLPAAESLEPRAWLFTGPLDPMLEDDLLRAPLLEASRARVVPCRSAELGGVLELLPLAALEPGAEHVLALGAWAIDEAEDPIALEIVTASAPDSGARTIASWPPDGAVGVGTDLPAAWLAFDGDVHGADAGVWLEGPEGRAVEAQVSVGACDALQQSLAPAAVQCARIEPSALLAPLAPHRLVVGGDAIDGYGAPIGPFAASFRTAQGPDGSPPLPAVRACAIDEQAFELGCALVSDRFIELRIAASEPFELALRSGGLERTELAPAAEAELRLDGLEPGAEVEIELELRDSTGNTLAHTLRLRTHADLAELSITEVRADPLGPEPAQELVELWNFGPTRIELRGLSLSDQSDELGAPIEIAAGVDPGARVLLVPEAFDIEEARDVPVPPGTPLVRLGRALASSGLANRGEALFLRDAQGRRLSAAPAIAPMPGVCLQRVGDDARDGSPTAFALDLEQRCSPGR